MNQLLLLTKGFMINPDLATAYVIDSRCNNLRKKNLHWVGKSYCMSQLIVVSSTHRCVISVTNAYDRYQRLD